MTWPKSVTLRSTSPRKSIKEQEKRVPREAEERKDVRKHVCGHELVYFDSPCAETLDVNKSLPEKQHDGVIAISMPGVVPSSSAGAMPFRNPPISPNWTSVPDCSVYPICLINYKLEGYLVVAIYSRFLSGKI